MSRRVSDKLGKLLIITSFILFAIAAYMSNIVNHQYDSEGRLVAGSGNLFITVRPEDELTAEDINDNGATGGDVPEDATKYNRGATVTVCTNSRNLTKTHYAFSHWNTKMDDGWPSADYLQWQCI